MTESRARTRVDACPGALQVHPAADGGLARVRLPGGMLTAAQLEVLADAAEELSDGALELTSRGNLQLRALPAGAEVELAERLAGAGLLPSATHETVRNVVASPLTGRLGGLLDVRPLVTGFDTALRADPVLAALPGRFLASFDDGRGDVTGLAADVGVHAVTADALAVVLAGVDSGVRVAPGDAVALLRRAATAFHEVRGSAWRLAEVPDGAARVRAALDGGGEPEPLATAAGAPVGWLAQDDGLVSLGAVVPLGRLDAGTARFLAAVERPLVVTPWRGVVVTDLDEDVADALLRFVAPRGLVFDAASEWSRVTSCAGRPGCAKALADVRTDAASAVATGTLPGDGAVHFSGCERRCGRPRGEVLDVVATPDGYAVG
ncbi:precorrin-3B synthase [Rhodococcus aerolatus]